MVTIIILRDVLPSPRRVCRHAGHIAIDFRHSQVGPFAVTGSHLFRVRFNRDCSGRAKRPTSLVLRLDRVQLNSMLCPVRFGIRRIVFNCRIYIVHNRVNLRTVFASDHSPHMLYSCHVTTCHPSAPSANANTVRSAFVCSHEK